MIRENVHSWPCRAGCNLALCALLGHRRRQQNLLVVSPVSQDNPHNPPVPDFRDLPERIATLIVTALRNERGVHAETAIATAAVLVGECVLRAHIANLSDLPPQSALLSDDVNRTLFEGDHELTISDVFINALFAQGIDVSTRSWVETIPEEHQLILDPLAVIARIRPRLEDAFTQAGAHEMLERAYATASATALLVAQTRKVLDPNIGKALALESILRGAKTVPLPTAIS